MTTAFSFKSLIASAKKNPLKAHVLTTHYERKSLNLHSRDVADPVMCSRIQTANYQ